MNDDRIAAVTPQQLACLRLLPTLHTYKAIARQLDLSPKTVENHIAKARATLGAADRWEAAALVAASDRAGGKSPSGEDRIPTTTALPPPVELTSNPGDQLFDVASERIMPFDPATSRFRLPNATQGAERDGHHPLRVVGLIGLVAVAILLIVAATPPAAKAWSELANVISPHRN